MYEACNIDPNNSQREDQSDAAFINARQLSSGTIREGMLYRGASPFDNKFGRAELMGDYLEAQGITYILDLADSPEKLLSYENLPEYTASLIREEKVIALHLGIDYTTPEAMAAIKEGVFFLSEANSPVLIHCSIGRDRTGFICALLEALCGASYDEILDDYMLSYENLHDINMDPDSLQYQLFSDRLLELFELNVGLKREDIKTADLKETARNYFLRCDLTEEQVDQLIRNITVQQ